MFGTSLPPVVCRRTHVIFALLKKMFVHSDVHHFVLSCVFVFWVPCCDFYNDFSMEWCLVCLCFQLFVEGLMICLYCYTPAPRRGRGVCCFTSVRLFFRPSVLPVLLSIQDIFRHIFLSNCWWQKSDIWSQASYRYTILWVAFLDPSDSYFLFADFVDFYTHLTYICICIFFVAFF